ncbi:hypothetical protein M9H77_13070 [Catharanthus roseus]|uniref:Uncharacterized protein n=1 Tax=Catharanthus roseus TaxID=4058 RepID=A0ACC0BJ64_CATRO|nr:hypothetical protein M9H77_13070 [Catharanthus roseus]
MTKEEVREEAAAFAVQPNRRDPPSSERAKNSCFLCKKNGHKARNCFTIIGYSDWWPDSGKECGSGSNNRSGRGGRSYSCRGRGGNTNPRGSCSQSWVNVAAAADQIPVSLYWKNKGRFKGSYARCQRWFTCRSSSCVQQGAVALVALMSKCSPFAGQRHSSKI